MVNKELLDYIRDVKSKGYLDDQIKSHLIQYGYSKEIIDEAFLSLKTYSKPVVEEKPFNTSYNKPVKKKQKKSNKVFLIIGILFIVIILTVIGFLLFQNMKYVECDNVSIVVHKIKGEDVLCVFPDNSKIMTIVENDGQQTVKNLIFEIKSFGTTKIKLENVNIPPGGLSTHTLNYGKQDIKQIRIIPETAEKTCKGKVYTEIKNC